MAQCKTVEISLLLHWFYYSLVQSNGFSRTQGINSLAPGKFEWNFGHVIFKHILVIAGWGISSEIAQIWMSLDFIDDQSILVQVMAWCRQAASHYLSQCWPRSLTPYGITRPQWVKMKQMRWSTWNVRRGSSQWGDGEGRKKVAVFRGQSWWWNISPRRIPRLQPSSLQSFAETDHLKMQSGQNINLEITSNDKFFASDNLQFSKNTCEYRFSIGTIVPKKVSNLLQKFSNAVCQLKCWPSYSNINVLIHHPLVPLVCECYFRQIYGFGFDNKKFYFK